MFIGLRSNKKWQGNEKTVKLQIIRGLPLIILFVFACEGDSFDTVIFSLVSYFSCFAGVLVLDEFFNFSAKSRVETLCREKRFKI